MDEIGTKFFTQESTPLVWFRFIVDIFFIWTHGKEHLEIFLQELNIFNPDLKFTYESNEKEIPFLDLKVKLNEGEISTDLYIKSTDSHQAEKNLVTWQTVISIQEILEKLEVPKMCINK